MAFDYTKPLLPKHVHDQCNIINTDIFRVLIIVVGVSIAYKMLAEWHSLICS